MWTLHGKTDSDSSHLRLFLAGTPAGLKSPFRSSITPCAMSATPSTIFSTGLLGAGAGAGVLWIVAPMRIMANIRRSSRQSSGVREAFRPDLIELRSVSKIAAIVFWWGVKIPPFRRGIRGRLRLGRDTIPLGAVCALALIDDTGHRKPACTDRARVRLPTTTIKDFPPSGELAKVFHVCNPYC
jgi:hypothetical protein